MRFDARIPNLVSELKPDNIWPLFWQQNKKLSKTGKIPDITRFRPFFGEKNGQMLSILILMPDLESSHQGTSNLHQIEIKIYGRHLMDP